MDEEIDMIYFTSDMHLGMKLLFICVIDLLKMWKK